MIVAMPADADRVGGFLFEVTITLLGDGRSCKSYRGGSGMYPGVELRLLRYVVAVAEELHFSRAAAKLHLAQPSLSKQIRELEEELGTELFERTKREVRLSDAGRIFVKEAKQALLYSHRAVHLTKASRHGSTFSLGYSPHINFEILFRARTALATHFPN